MHQQNRVVTLRVLGHMDKPPEVQLTPEVWRQVRKLAETQHFPLMDDYGIHKGADKKFAAALRQGAEKLDRGELTGFDALTNAEGRNRLADIINMAALGLGVQMMYHLPWKANGRVTRNLP